TVPSPAASSGTTWACASSATTPVCAQKRGRASTSRSSGIPVRTPSTVNSPNARRARAQAASASPAGTCATTLASNGSYRTPTSAPARIAVSTRTPGPDGRSNRVIRPAPWAVTRACTAKPRGAAGGPDDLDLDVPGALQQPFRIQLAPSEALLSLRGAPLPGLGQLLGPPHDPQAASAAPAHRLDHHRPGGQQFPSPVRAVGPGEHGNP